MSDTLRFIEVHGASNGVRILVNANQIHSIADVGPVQIGVGATHITVRESVDEVLELLHKAYHPNMGRWDDGMDRVHADGTGARSGTEDER